MLLLRQTQGDRERKEERVRVGRGGEGRGGNRTVDLPAPR
jgi:hypothetical protein